MDERFVNDAIKAMIENTDESILMLANSMDQLQKQFEMVSEAFKEFNETIKTLDVHKGLTVRPTSFIQVFKPESIKFPKDDRRFMIVDDTETSFFDNVKNDFDKFLQTCDNHDIVKTQPAWYDAPPLTIRFTNYIPDYNDFDRDFHEKNIKDRHFSKPFLTNIRQQLKVRKSFMKLRTFKNLRF